MDIPPKIPSWLKKLGIWGTVIFVILVILKKVLWDAILEITIQNWWEETAIPFLKCSIIINFNIVIWHLILIFLGIVGSIIGLFLIFQRRHMKRSLFANEAVRVPFDFHNNGMTSTDVVNAIVDTRNGRITPQFLVEEVVIKAVNGRIIRPEIAQKTLKEFDFELVSRGDNSYTFTKTSHGE